MYTSNILNLLYVNYISIEFMKTIRFTHGFTIILLLKILKVRYYWNSTNFLPKRYSFLKTDNRSSVEPFKALMT